MNTRLLDSKYEYYHNQWHATAITEAITVLPPGCVDVLGLKPPTLSLHSEIKSRSCHHRVIQTGRIRYKWKTEADYRLQQDADRAN